ncbi:MAG: hypothetical protein ACYSUC_06025 [Planctomycetota bacterium]|jgi:hypothetical protein
MTNEISIGIGLANLPSDVDVATLRSFLEENRDGWEVYTLAPPKPGHMRAAAFDIMLVLGAAGSVASLAALLWTAYDKFIAPKKSQDTDSAGIYIGIRNPDDSVTDFWLGNTHKRREIFVKEFELKVTSIREQDDQGFWEESVTEVRESETWIRKTKN